MGANYFLLEQTSFQKRDKRILKEISPLKVYTLNYILLKEK